MLAEVMSAMKMSKDGVKLLAFLGDRGYDKVNYILPDRTVIESEYILDALVKYLEVKGVVLFLTDRAKEVHWEKIRERMEVLGIPVKIVDIKDPKTEKDVWELFDKMINNVEKGEKFAIDITHAFRHIPMICFLATLYLEEVKSSEISGIFYGHYEKGKDTTPVVELTALVDVAHWLYNTREFLRHYLAEDLSQRIKGLHNSLRRSGVDVESIQTMGELLKQFNRSFINCDMIETISYASKISRLLPEFKKEAEKSLAPLGPIIETLDQIDEVSCHEPRESPLTPKIVKRIQRVVEKYIEMGYLDNALRGMRENMVNLIIILISHLRNKELKWLERTEREYAERVLGGFLKEINNEEFEKRELYDEIKDFLGEDLVGKVTSLWNQISERRNVLAHCGMNQNETNLRGLNEVCVRLNKSMNELISEILTLCDLSSPSPPQ